MVITTKKKYLKLKEVRAYKIASDLSDSVWDYAMRWDWVAKRTIGVQWINSTDSIGGNIAEGFGRFHKKDKQRFFYNARGSVYESAHWTDKALKRRLISEVEYNTIMEKLRLLPREINHLIQMTEEKLTI